MNSNNALATQPAEEGDGRSYEKMIRREGCCSNCGSRQFVGYCGDCTVCGAWLKGSARLLPLTEKQLIEKASAEGVTLKELKRLCPEQFQ